MRLLDDAEPARWLVDAMVDFAVNVGSIVPRGFDAYARIFHSAYIERVQPELEPVKWTEIAEANDRIVHPLMQWPRIIGYAPHAGDRQLGLWDQEPEPGSIPREQLAALGPTLVAHTSTSSTMWFGVWEGYGGLHIPPFPEPQSFRPGLASRKKRRETLPPSTLHLPNRSYHLLEGRSDDLLASYAAWGWQSPNLIWPEDRAWCMPRRSTSSLHT